MNLILLIFTIFLVILIIYLLSIRTGVIVFIKEGFSSLRSQKKINEHCVNDNDHSSVNIKEPYDPISSIVALETPNSNNVEEFTTQQQQQQRSTKINQNENNMLDNSNKSVLDSHRLYMQRQQQKDKYFGPSSQPIPDNQIYNPLVQPHGINANGIRVYSGQKKLYPKVSEHARTVSSLYEEDYKD